MNLKKRRDIKQYILLCFFLCSHPALVISAHFRFPFVIFLLLIASKCKQALSLFNDKEAEEEKTIKNN